MYLADNIKQILIILVIIFMKNVFFFVSHVMQKIMKYIKSNHLLTLLLLGSWILMLGLATASGHGDPLEDVDNVPHLRSKRGIVWDFLQKMVITKNLIVDVSMIKPKSYIHSATLLISSYCLAAIHRYSEYS